MNAPLTLVPRSSLGSKYLMALTGLGLTGFVIGHMLGNLQVFLGPDALNSYARNLKNLGALLWVARIGLLVIFIAHIVYALRLQMANRAARPVGYASKRFLEATLASRTMLPTGLVILAFVIFHLAHFTFGVVEKAPVKDLQTGQTTYTPYLELHEKTDKIPEGRHDVYAMTVYGFRNPIVAGTYILAMAALAFHLSHGFQSLWQSLGLNHQAWAPLLKKAALFLAAVIFIGNSSMPIAILLRLVGGQLP